MSLPKYCVEERARGSEDNFAGHNRSVDTPQPTICKLNEHKMGKYTQYRYDFIHNISQTFR